MVKVTQADREAARTMLIELCAPMVELVTEEAALHFAHARIAGAKAALEKAAGALEEDAKLCDCFARSEGECGCGAWSDYKTVPMERAVTIVRDIDPEECE